MCTLHEFMKIAVNENGYKSKVVAGTRTMFYIPIPASQVHSEFLHIQGALLWLLILRIHITVPCTNQGLFITLENSE